MAFIRTKEDFQCEKCLANVTGDGYTNHCPACLWSKHVDINPGDRAAVCGGMMEPVSVEGGAEEYVLIHRCVMCGAIRRSKVARGDTMDAVIAISEMCKGSPYT